MQDSRQAPRRTALLLALAISAVAGTGATRPARAQQPITISAPAVHTGWYDSTGLHDPANDNYIVGNGNPYTPLTNDFFVFSLADLGPHNTALGATLRIDPNSGIPVSEYPYEPSLTLDLWDVSTPIPDLVAGGSGLTATYQDLGSGTSYGTFAATTDQLTAIDDGYSFTLNDAVVQALNADNGGLFAIGGSLDLSQLPPDPLLPGVPYGYKEFLFGASQSGAFGNGGPAGVHLDIIATPEPSQAAGLGLGVLCLCGLALGARRRVRVAGRE